MSTKELFMIGIAVILGLGIGILVLQWTEGNDREVMKAGDAYTKCVVEHFKMTPSEYYNENGEYPACEALK